MSDAPARFHARAWLLLTGALACHVADEALTGFLDVYNPTVTQLRARWPWLPLPTFSFRVWIVGLALAVALLASLTPLIRRGGRFATGLSLAFALIMLGNGVLHLAASIWSASWMPGATTAPLLLLSASLLAVATIRRLREA